MYLQEISNLILNPIKHQNVKNFKMNRILYKRRCTCNDSVTSFKRRNVSHLNDGKALPYPACGKIKSKSKIFQIRYEKKLSTLDKLVLNNLQKKYLYYAIDDILYFLKSSPIEKENLLSIIYSPIISLQNNFSINFFDIWIEGIYINEVSKVNKFISNNSQNLEQFSYITIKLVFRPGVPIKKREILW